MHDLYLKALINAMEQYKQGADERESIYKLVFYGIKAINSRPKIEYTSLQQIENNIAFNNTILGAIGALTPKELLNIFPLEKYYKGARYEAKDYFYSMNHIKQYGINTPIKDAMSFLWEYMNNDTRLFTVNILSDIDLIRKATGEDTIMGEFMEAQGIKPLRKYTAPNGKEYFIDHAGRTMRIKKKYPRYLKLVR